MISRKYRNSNRGVGMVAAGAGVMMLLLIMGLCISNFSVEMKTSTSAPKAPQARAELNESRTGAIPTTSLTGTADRAPGGRIEGVVIEQINDKPVPKALVWLVSESTRLMTRTDAGGQFDFSGLPDASYELSATPPAGSGLVPSGDGGVLCVAIEAGEQLEGIRIVFLQGITLNGLVFDESSGEGISESTVEIECYYAKRSMDHSIERVITTDDDGKFSFDGLPPVGLLEIRATAPYFVAGQTQTFEGLLSEVSPVYLALVGGAGRIVGSVRNPRNEPVTSFRLFGVGESGQRRATLSDNQGRFELDNLSPGWWKLYSAPNRIGGGGAARVPGVRETLAEVEVVGGQTVEVALRANTHSGAIQGRVIDERGSPVAGVALSAGWEQPVLGLSDEVGAFVVSIADAPNSVVRLVAQHPQYGETISDAVALGERNVLITFPLGGTVEGHVVSKRDGRPIPSFHVRAEALPGKDGGPEGLSLEQRFFSREGYFLFGPLQPGEYDVVAWAEGFGKSAPAPVGVGTANGLRKLEFALLPEIRLVGTVTSAESGRPIAGVHVCTQAGADDIINADAVTDVTGEFTVFNLTAGTIAIRLFHPEYQSLDTRVELSGVPETYRQFVLALGAELKGTVYYHGVPKPNASVRAVSSSGNTALEITGADGAYRFGNLESGEYDVLWYDDTGAARSQHVALAAGYSTQLDIFTEVSANTGGAER